MRKIAIIPARGGSKRIPRKNIKLFLGKPIIAYSIEAAVQSGLFDEVMVSTDDEEISEIAKYHGANVPFYRSEKNSDDQATLNDVLEEITGVYSKAGQTFALGCCILPTAPFVTKHTLLQGYQLMNEMKFDSVRPMVRFSYPIQRAFKMDSTGRVSMMNPALYRVRSQDLEPAYHDAGQFYWFRFPTLLKSDNRGGFFIEETNFQDIDTPSDWALAEIKYQYLLSQ